MCLFVEKFTVINYSCLYPVIIQEYSRPISPANKAEQAILLLLRKLKNENPEWNNAVYLLRYQMLSYIIFERQNGRQNIYYDMFAAS